MLKTPPAIYKQMGNPTSTTALMGQITQGLGVDSGYNGGLPTPTNTTGTALYTDGSGVNHFSIDSTTPGRQLMRKAGMVKTLGTTDTQTARMDTDTGGMTRAWGLQVMRFDPGFTPDGTGPGAEAFKWGNWFNCGNSGQGRIGAEQTGGDIDNYCGCASSAGGQGRSRLGVSQRSIQTAKPG